MSGWAHAVGSHVARRGAERPGPGAACWVPMMGSGLYSACGCTTPTPDPASPCARCGQPEVRHERVLGLSHWYCPTHLPTLCKNCHHPIAAVPE